MDQQDQAQWWEEFQEVDAFWRQFFDVSGRAVSEQDVKESALDVPF